MKEHSIRRFIHVADVVTITGLLMGVTSIFTALAGHPVAAALLIIGSIVCDYLDGYIARKRGTAGEFGVALDGFNDFLTYLVSIAVFGYAAGLDSAIDLAVILFFVTMGALRLARFAVIGVTEGCYEGLPSSFSVLILPAYFLLAHFGLRAELLLPLYFVIGALMVTTIRVRKPGYKVVTPEESLSFEPDALHPGVS